MICDYDVQACGYDEPDPWWWCDKPDGECGWCGAPLPDPRDRFTIGTMPWETTVCARCWAQEPWMYVYAYGGTPGQRSLSL